VDPGPAGPQDPPSTGLTAAADELAAGSTGRWLRLVSQFGLVSRAVVYLLVGYLTMRIALGVNGRSGEPASGTGAVQEAARHAWGQVSLALLAAGFAGYSLTQLVEVIFRPRDVSSAVHRWRQRVISSSGCLLYAAFCVSTVSLLVAGRRPDRTPTSEQRQDTAVSAALLGTGLGRLVLLLTGILVVIAGVEIGRRSVRLTFQERFTTRLSAKPFGIVVRALGAVGCVARATVFVLVGVFVTKAAVLGEPRELKGVDATLRSVARSHYGPITLGALAIGLFAYGLYCLLEARYRDLTPGR
jgi:Domain of Unknown Function (DUF1206)